MASVVHISEEEAVKDPSGLFERVRAGEQVVVEASGRPSVLMAVPENTVSARSVSAIVEGLRHREQVQGLAVPNGFAANVAEAPKTNSASRDGSTWERRTISEAREILRLRRASQGLAVPDPDFAADTEAVRAITNAPMDYSRWD